MDYALIDGNCGGKAVRMVGYVEGGWGQRLGKIQAGFGIITLKSIRAGGYIARFGNLV